MRVALLSISKFIQHEQALQCPHSHQYFKLMGKNADKLKFNFSPPWNDIVPGPFVNNSQKNFKIISLDLIFLEGK